MLVTLKRMFCVELHKTITWITWFFYLLGFWHRGDKVTVRERIIKISHLSFYWLFTASLTAGAITSENILRSIFSIEIAIITGVLSVKLFYVIWKKNQILDLLRKFGVYYIEDYEDVILVNDKVKSFMKFSIVFYILVNCSALSCAIVVPFLGSEKTLFLESGFLMDWKNNETEFWIAFTFGFFGTILSIIIVLVTIIIWYAMLNCALKYTILGNQIRNMGVRSIVEVADIKLKKLGLKKQNLFQRDLIAIVKTYQDMKKYKRLISNLSNIKFFYFCLDGPTNWKRSSTLYS